MKTINLTQGKIALVDDDMFDYLNQWKWYAIKSHNNTYYAGRCPSANKSGKRNIVFMHRVVMETPIELRVDHKDHNGLNCQRNNMRNCSISGNNKNRTPKGRSRYLGVTFNGNSIYATIFISGKNKHLGSFKTEEAAAKAYDNMAKIIHGEFANLNFKS